MLNAAKSAVPIAAPEAIRQLALERAIDGAITLFVAPPGYFPTESLAARVIQRGLAPVWLHLDQADRDPGKLLLSLIAAVRRVSPEAGKFTIEEMQARPGPVYGWPPLYSNLAHELANQLTRSSVLVIEHLHHLNATPSTLRLLGQYFLPILISQSAFILISDRPLPLAALPDNLNVRGVGDLRLDLRAGLELARSIDADLSDDCINRAIRITGGRMVAVSGIYSASEALGSTFIHNTVRRSDDLPELLRKIARAWFTSAELGALRALSLAARLEYFHPTLSNAIMDGKTPLEGPWLQPLADNWSRVRHLWQPAIHSILRSNARMNKADLQRAAEYLIRQGAQTEGIRLYLETHDMVSTALSIVGVSDSLLNLGLWDTLKGWLNSFSRSALAAWPRLIYIRGELAIAEGQISAARNDFSEAADLYSLQNDYYGACQSYLAESTLAAWQGNLEFAQSRALMAKAFAVSANLTQLQGWSEWQLGCLAVAAGKLEEGLLSFGQAVSALNDPLMKDVFDQVQNITSVHSQSRRQSDYHYREYLKAQQKEQVMVTHLQQMLSCPPDNLEDHLLAHGWSNTPIGLKHSIPSELKLTEQNPGHKKIWQQLLLQLRKNRFHGPEPGSSPEIQGAYPLVNSAASVDLPRTTILTAEIMPPGDVAVVSLASVSAPLNQSTMASERSLSSKEEQSTPTLSAYLLGSFRVSIKDHAIDQWPGGRAVSVFKFLLTYHKRRTPRDVLMDAFWPDVQSEAARNSLNVALHGVRRAFRTITDIPIILFDNGTYILNPDIALWIDIDEFERHLTASRQMEATGQRESAVRELEIAASLYQGDFLEEDPYEDWAVLTRERLRIAYLDLLDHLSRVYFDLSHYTACANLCQLILVRDRCNEQASRRLMQCYSRQGQYNLAIRHYQTLVETLRKELEVDPDPATIEIAERIRYREQV